MYSRNMSFVISGSFYFFAMVSFFLLPSPVRASDPGLAHLEAELTRALQAKDEDRAILLYHRLEQSLELLRFSRSSAEDMTVQLDDMIAKAIERSEDPELSPTAIVVHKRQKESLEKQKSEVSGSIAKADKGIRELEASLAVFASDPVLKQRLEEQAVINRVEDAVNAAGDIKLPGE